MTTAEYLLFDFNTKLVSKCMRYKQEKKVDIQSKVDLTPVE